MGLLDDAIREHLDLKRRRGSDPAEVERMEREALGPVRRGPSPLEAGADAATGYGEMDLEEQPVPEAGRWADPVQTRPAYEQQDAASSYEGDPSGIYDDEQDFVGEPLAGGHASPSSGEGADYDDFEEEDPAAHTGRSGVGPVHFRPRSLRDRLLRREAPMQEDEPDDEPTYGAMPAPRAPAAPIADPEPPASYGQETVEYQALDEDPGVPPEQAERGDAILEETPEFLQDTPDHDRLWFEQRPPRDFDFDG
jgi:hypothetical protein